jgi:myosin heavy subunit
MKEYYSNKFNNEFVQKILNFNKNSYEQKNNKENFLLNKFKQDLNLLEESLNKTDCHYIHCIKINGEKKKDEFNSYFVLNQIRHLGIFDTISLMQKSFFYKLSFKEFYLKYEDVIDIENKPNIIEINNNKVNMKELSIKVMDQILPEYQEKKNEYVMGINKILMRMSLVKKLNKYRNHIICEKEKWVTKFATIFRSRKIRRVFLLIKFSI